MGGYEFARADEEVLDLSSAEHLERLERAILRLSEPRVYAELAAIARTAPEATRAERGFQPLDPAGRPS